MRTGPGALSAALLSLLAACTSGGTEPVSSEGQAVAIAKERCAFSWPAVGFWHARLHDGQWHVWWVPDATLREPAIGTRDIRIRAADGEAGDCNHAQ